MNSRTRLLLQGRYPQQPTIYATNKNLRDSFFLGGASENEGIKGNVVYHSEQYKWLLDLGVVHGITDDPGNPTVVKLLNWDGDEVATATVDKALVSNSELAIDPEALNSKAISKKETYTGLVENVFRPYISFHLTGEAEGVEILNNYFKTEERLKSLDNKNIKLVDSEVDAQYVIRAVKYASSKQGQFLVTRPFDPRPLVRQVFYFDKHVFTALERKYMGHIVIWEFVKNLYNEKSRLEPKTAIEIRVYKVINEKNPNLDELLPVVNGEVEIANGDSIRIEAVNNNRRKKLYYTLFYLDPLFKIYPMSKEGAYLNPEKSFWVQEGEGIELEVDDYAVQFNYEIYSVALKCIYSTTNISLHDFEQEGLDPPKYPALGAEDGDRPIEKRKRPNGDDWGTHDITIVVRNEKFEKGKIVG